MMGIDLEQVVASEFVVTVTSVFGVTTIRTFRNYIDAKNFATTVRNISLASTRDAYRAAYKLGPPDLLDELKDVQIIITCEEEV